jgi:hypothetical protein
MSADNRWAIWAIKYGVDEHKSEHNQDDWYLYSIIKGFKFWH